MPTTQKKHLLEDLKNTLGHHNLNQCCKDNTWCRIINGEVKQSLLDHVYETKAGMVTNLKLTDHAYSDHKMLEFLVKEKTHPSIQEPVRMRD